MPVSRERQREAMQFLSAHAFTTPMFVIRPEILRRIEPTGTLDRIRTSQLRVLATLLAESRIGRLVEQEAVDGAAAYRPDGVFRRRAAWQSGASSRRRRCRSIRIAATCSVRISTR